MEYAKKGILVASILLILIGLSDNGFRDVMGKAIHICYECIGIG